MSAIPSLSEPDPIPVAEPSTTTGANPLLKRLFAALLSTIVPGTRQLLLGHLRAGAFFLAGFVAALMLFWPMRLPQSDWGLTLSFLVLVGLSIFAAWHALRSPQG